MQNSTGTTNSIQSVERAIDILCCFSIEEPELGISEIAARLGMYKSTIHRILKTLETKKFVVQNLQNAKYRLGFKLFDLGNAVVSKLEIREVALPFMRDLSARTRETVTLNIVDNDQRVCIEKVEGSENIRNFVQIGLRNSLYLGSSGRVLLAFLPEQETERIIACEKTGCTTQGKPIEAGELRKELALIRERGYAVGQSQRNLGAASVGVPIRDYQGKVVAGLGVSGPEARFTGERLNVIITEATTTAEGVSARLGWSG